MSKIRIKTRWYGWQSNNASNRERRTVKDNNASKKASGMGPEFTLRFGKHAGCKVKDLPLDYLKWMASEQQAEWAVDEMVRRGSVPAPSKKSSSERKQAKRKARKERRIKRKEVFSEIQRNLAASRMAEMQSGILIEGSDYQRLRDEFDRAGGDPDDCPFDTTDYQYTGPSMVRVGGKTVIVPIEFPQETVR